MVILHLLWLLASISTKGVLRHPRPLHVISGKWVPGVMAVVVFSEDSTNYFWWRRWADSPLWPQSCGSSMVSVSLGLILEGLSPTYDPDPAIMLCLLFLTVRYICNFGSKAPYTKSDSPRHRHLALEEVHALTYTTFFVPWIPHE